MNDVKNKKMCLPTGFGGSYDDDLSSGLDLNHLLIDHPASTYFMRVEGDGLVSAGAANGDILIVDRGLHPVNGDLVIAVVEGELVLRLLKDTKSERQLISENDCRSFPIQESSEIEFWGVVTARIKQFRRTE